MSMRPWIFIGKRLVSAVVTLVSVVVIVFVVFQVVGDPARRTLPLNASEEQVQEYRHSLGYDDPIAEQAGRYLSGALRLDFGVSTTAGRPATEVVMEALPRSLFLAAGAFLITAVLAVALGLVAGMNVGKRTDRILQTVGAVASSVPEFWSGLVLIILFAVQLRFFPTGGYGGLPFLVLPAVAMAIPPVGRLMYVVRESVRATLQEPFMLVARGKGLARWTLLQNHVLRAAVIPILSVGGLELTRMAIGGVVVIESVFAWPGIGRLYTQAMERYDIALVSATLVVATGIVLIMNTILDLLYTRLDPRIEVMSK
ncbi:ABC transporter permease [Nonomuraea sp. K274]|uniref:ABC transporter permease n=1 Tax=Nonomuraea cypriaca TaxID=1187855 RepID=A0A931EZL7_9ACTN|nr:ABC transporter permease [Nonomuraea cypriaca]MBF8189979.1 ABC transporter permease [Nonomuraea cypriaca]